MGLGHRLEANSVSFQNNRRHGDHGVKTTPEVASRIEPVQILFISPLMSVPFVLDRASRLPLHRQIYEAWRTGILSGRFRAGERVPSSRALTATYDVARVTVSAAYDQLLAE